MTKPWMVIAGACIGAAPMVVIAEPAPKVEWVEVDAPMMCAMIAREYRTREIRDLVTVSAATAVEKKTDSFEVFLTPAPSQDESTRVEILIGPLHAVAQQVGDTGAATIVVTHAKVPDRMIDERTEEGGVMALIGDTLPPIPMPQVWAALADARPACPGLGPYLGAVRWTKAELSPQAVPPRVRMLGEAADTGAAVELVAVVEPVVRLERIVIRDEPAGSTIEITIEPLEPGAAPPAQRVEGRTRVGSLAELVGEETASSR